MKLLATGVAIAAVATAAHAADVHPFEEPAVTGETAFLETFSAGIGSWIGSADEKYNGVPTVVVADKTEDKGLYVDSPARHYGVSSLLAKPFDPSEGLVLQYEVTLQDGLDCGGAYLKFLTATDDLAPESLDGDSPYTVMFGPDKCGGTNKVHVIFRHKNPLDGTVEEKHLATPPSMVSDSLPHLYTLVVRPDNTFEVRVDGEVKSEGDLLADFEPPFNPPAEIDDPEDSKPADWVDDAKIDDPEAVKPDDWDEDAPREIPDEEAEKPEGWLDDEPAEVEDPSAEQPEDWDEDEDGTWEAPIVPNPKCEEAPGCGEWKRPNKRNPDYKGKWYPPLVDNPAYKGPWSPRKIPNPNFYEDKTPMKSVGSIGAVALEIWTMSKGIVIDNVLVAKDDVAAKELETTQWKPKHAFMTEVAREAAEAEEAEARKVDTAGFASRVSSAVTDALYAVADVVPEGAARDAVRGFVDTLVDSTAALFSFVALVVTLLFLGVSTIFGGKAEEDEAAVAKKTDTTGPDDEKEKDEDEDEEDEEEEEEEPPKTASKRRARRAN